MPCSFPMHSNTKVRVDSCTVLNFGIEVIRRADYGAKKLIAGAGVLLKASLM